MSSSTQRLLAVLELLQSRDEITGSEIAERLDVDGRSVRRYIKSLQEMGNPMDGIAAQEMHREGLRQRFSIKRPRVVAICRC